MATALHINTIHDIISAVEQSDSSHGIFSSSSSMRRRARYLSSEAHTLLSMLRFRGEMGTTDRAEYEYLYDHYQRAACGQNARSQLEAAQDLWSFALYQARDTSHNLITEVGRDHHTRDTSRNPPRAPVVPPDTHQHQHVSAPVIPPDTQLHTQNGQRRQGTPAPPEMRQHQHVFNAPVVPPSAQTQTQTRTRRHGDPEGTFGPIPVVPPETRHHRQRSPAPVVPPPIPVAPNDASGYVSRAHLRPPLLPQLQHAPVVPQSSRRPDAQPAARAPSNAPQGDRQRSRATGGQTSYGHRGPTASVRAYADVNAGDGTRVDDAARMYVWHQILRCMRADE
ncbi:hypothetical protein EVJ58_g2804 [Rhodofomes roseus]|uniref:Uncharacterized protein n=1 Tax=Rhodofomes roseus TaxID=34475 RepID=A0A4Y9YR13_9APHY|nr:hypothetical protein EVJ58_g2804 [Rhodofomes roseus]